MENKKESLVIEDLEQLRKAILNSPLNVIFYLLIYLNFYLDAFLL